MFTWVWEVSISKSQEILINRSEMDPVKLALFCILFSIIDKSVLIQCLERICWAIKNKMFFCHLTVPQHAEKSPGSPIGPSSYAVGGLSQVNNAPQSVLGATMLPLSKAFMLLPEVPLHGKWDLRCHKLFVSLIVWIISCLGSRFHAWN